MSIVEQPVMFQVLEPLALDSFQEKNKAGVITTTTAELDSGPSTGPTPSSIIEDDTVCITGMACRLPGGITNTSQLWNFLHNKKTATGPVPEGRWNINGFFHQDNKRAGVINIPGGHFLDLDPREFDNSFFGINNLEAAYMDPQQRQLLEVVYECLEDAGVTMEEINGTHTAVYVGNFTVDYQVMQTRDPDYQHRLGATGAGTSIMSNRISHVFNLHGPSMTLDTACSSTIYALHNAVTAMKAGDCDAAIVAGANLITSPEQHIGTAKGGFLSPTSACHTFDSSADGYARAEAVNAIYIKRLSSAMKNDDKIHAVIRGTAINANGHTPGITLPDAKLQETVIRKAYQNAGLDFAETDYVECHGTGTAVGDPIEVEGLASCFKPRDGEPLRIGSVKTNLGHAEAASGLTSVIKVALAFEHGVIPPTYGVKNLNPKLKLEERTMKVLNTSEAWPRPTQRASINSFGYGGANGHVVLESIQSYLNGFEQVIDSSLPEVAPSIEDNAYVLPFSASSAASLKARQQQITDLVENTDRAGLRQLASIMGKREAKLRIRSYKLASNSPRPSLLQVGDGGADKAVPGAPKLPFAFVFTGQGAQYAGMGKELLDSNPAFLSSIKELDRVLRSLPTEHRPTWTLEQTIRDPPASSQINDVTRSQPICTAVQIGLVDLLRSWGVKPQVVIGHSSGEIAASYSSGLLSAPQAILAAYFRGFAVGKLKSRGCMMAAGITPTAGNELIQELGLKQVRVACVNAPESVTLSGALPDIDALEAKLKEQGKFARKLETGGRAYHSHMMTEVGDLYEQLVAPYFPTSVRSEPMTASMFSTVGDAPEDIAAVDLTTNMASYLRKNLEKPVQFSAGLTNLLSSDKFHLIELGPHAALKGPVQSIRKAAKRDGESAPYAPTLVRKEDGHVCLLRLAATLFTFGHSIDWQVVNQVKSESANGAMRPALALLKDSTSAPVSLPPYPWDYSQPLVWHEPRASVEMRNRKHIRHELLGTQAVAGNGIDWAWRCILRRPEMPWLDDHKLEKQVVLPGAAYLTMAIEAVSQARDLKGRLLEGDAMTFECHNVSINSAFLPPEDKSPEAEHTELHTTLSQRKISTASASSVWYDFTISSWASGTSTLHCSGSIRVIEDATPLKETVPSISEEGYEVWGMQKWYKKILEEGLNFGPAFRSLSTLATDGSRVSPNSVATTKLHPPNTDGQYYAVHPIVLDACLQAAIFGGTAGNLHTLKAFVPVFVSECSIHVPQGGFAPHSSVDSKVYTATENTGFATRRINCTVRRPDGVAAIDMKDVRLQLYNGKAPPATNDNIFQQRSPCLRITWKPDVLRLSPGCEDTMAEYIEDFGERQSEDMQENRSNIVFAAILELASHRTSRMRVLELRKGGATMAEEILLLLGKDTAFPGLKSWSNAVLGADGKVELESSKESEFDVIVIPARDTTKAVWSKDAEKAISLLSENGLILTRKTPEAISALKSAGFTSLELPSQIMLARRGPKTTGLDGKQVLVLVPNKSSSITDTVANALKKYVQQNFSIDKIATISVDEIDNVEITEHVVVISLLELENEFLATVSAEDMNRFRKITDNSTNLAWVTGSDMLGAPNPDLTLSSGLSRALMLEQPALRFTVIDVGQPSSLADDMTATCANVVRGLTSNHKFDDTEFIQRDGLLYVSRFVPDVELNSTFRQRLLPEEEEAMATTTLAELGRAALSIGQVGVTDSIHFQQLSEPTTAPPAGFVDVDIRSVGLNAKDIYAMNGRVETKGATIALDFGGVISAVGPDVKHVQVGDRVAGLAPHYWHTTERVPAAAVHKLLPEEDMNVVPTLLTVTNTAIHALRDRAHLQAGESVLIHAGAGAFGLSAIAMAKDMGATVYTTCGSQSKRDYLVREAGVPAENIFNSRDASFVDGIKKATNGRGVDVIVNSLVGDLMHATWSCIAPFGRFVEIGKKELIDSGKLDMSAFLRNSTFTAFDLSEYYWSTEATHRNKFHELTAETMALWRAGKIKAAPIVTYDVSDIAQAYRYFNNKDRVGKVVINMENRQSRVQVAPARHSTVFSPVKTYLLVGCLGGLGRSLSRWMMSRGARKFVLMGRSGCDKPAAQELVDRLRFAGASVTVVRGDVVDADHVKKAVAACVENGQKIGGVVQAAMGLREALFSVMPNQAWHTGIQPKWRGTWNIHNALEGNDSELDFFLMTSSVSGSVGTATESNYCSANGFLDSFAHWRRSQGKPAISLGLGMISEVGYLHENPDIEAMLLRKGIQPLNEEEFLQVIDYGLAGVGGEKDFAARTPKATLFESAHILTGLESNAIRDLISKGFDINNGIMEDPRSSLLAGSILAEIDAKNEAAGGADAGTLAAAAEWAKDVPAAALTMFGAEVAAPTMHNAVLRMAKKRFSSLILMPLDQVDDRASLPTFGVDSMLAAEFRTWFWNTFKVDIPFLDIISPQKSLYNLAEAVEEKMVAAWAA